MWPEGRSRKMTVLTFADQVGVVIVLLTGHRASVALADSPIAAYGVSRSLGRPQTRRPPIWGRRHTAP